MNKNVVLPVVAGKEVGHWRKQALTLNEVADDIMRLNKDRCLISFAAAARYIGVKENQAKLLLYDLPRYTVGERQKIHAKDLAKWIIAGQTFQMNYAMPKLQII